MTQKRRPYLIIQAPLDFWGELLGMIALAGVMIIRTHYMTTNPTFATDSLYLCLGCGAALGISILAKILYHVFTTDRALDPRLVRFTYKQEYANGKLFDAGDIRVDMVGCSLTYFAIQIIIWVIGEEAYQVSMVDRVLFYVFAAIIEEVIYRGAIVMLAQLFFAKLMHVKDGSLMIIVNVLVMLISGITFAASHVDYYGDPIKMTITFLGGMSQAFWYMRSKVLLVPMVAHGAINMLYAKSFVQGVTK